MLQFGGPKWVSLGENQSVSRDVLPLEALGKTLSLSLPLSF
jgi:hypothetical protein